MRLNLLPFIGVLLAGGSALADPGAAPPAPAPPNESVLGELPISGTVKEHVIKLAVLPSLSPDMEDVIVRGVVRRDLELSGMFEVIPDRKAPAGAYGFEDPVDVDAWRKVGAEVIVKVAARKQGNNVQVFGLAYFLHVGKEPVYEKKLVVPPEHVRVTAHRVTDALLGAITGRDGGFASHLTYSGRWGKHRRIFTVDADGHDLQPRTPEDQTAIAPTWGPKGIVYYPSSIKYAPYELFMLAADDKPKKVGVPFKNSIYSVAFNKDHTKMALAVADFGKSSIYVGNADGSDMKKVSGDELATHAVFSPSGKLAWVGGGGRQGSQRVYVDGKAVSPAGFTAAAPTFCDTEDGIRIIYSVAVGGDRQDLVMMNERGGGTVRLTQNAGSNSYPACSPDGRMLGFFSTRGGKKGLYIMSLKRFGTQQMSTQWGESLRWDRLPPPPKAWMP